MPPAVTVLQLDTGFPRVPGDVGCPETYRGRVEIIRIPNATVGQIVTADPASIPMAPFEAALERARGDVVVTSCGFLSYWQDHLAARTTKPFVSSALMALPELCQSYAPHSILTLTFDADALTAAHLRGCSTDVIGLPQAMPLRQVISQNHKTLDTDRAGQDIAAYVADQKKPWHRCLLLECTNLPPYKQAIRRVCDLPIVDILTCIEDIRPGTVRAAFLNP